MRLIGIKTGTGDSLVMKNLQENTWYPFGEYTEPTKENGWRWQSEKQIASEKACEAMYKLLAENKESSLEITVNCIVGKNGSGKSSLLDLFYRIINNFSLQLFDRQWEDNDPNKNPQRGHYLEEANSFDATLFFETDGVVGSIRYCYGNFEYNYHKNLVLHILDLKERYPIEKRKEISRLLSAQETDNGSAKYSEAQIEADILQEEFNQDRCFAKLR